MLDWRVGQTETKATGINIEQLKNTKSLRYIDI